MTELASLAVSIASEQIGRGEEFRNNDGTWVRTYTGGRVGNWCAAFVAWCYERAAELLGEGFSAPERSHGAKRYVRNVAAFGRFVDVKREDPEPGDVIAWDRGTLGWQGHVGIVLLYLSRSDTLITIEGNSGKFPSVVKIKVYPNGEWRKKLYRVARP